MRTLIATLALILSFQIGNSQVGINTNSPDPSALLEIKGNTGGLLIPRMTANQRAGIPLNKPGLLVYDNTLRRFMATAQSQDSLFWQVLGPNWRESATALYLDSTLVKPVGIGTNSPAPGALLHIAGQGGVQFPTLRPESLDSLPYVKSGMMALNQDGSQLLMYHPQSDTTLWTSLGPHWIRDGGTLSWKIDSLVPLVGIGTEQPQTMLHITGQITSDALVGNGYRPLFADQFGTITQWIDTIMVQFTALDFKGPDQIIIDYTDDYIMVGLNEGSGGMLYAPIRPTRSGLICDTLWVSFLDNSPADMTISLVAAAMNGSAMQTIVAATTSGSMPGVIQTMAIGIPVSTPVNLRDRLYYIKVESPNWGAGNLRMLGGAVRLMGG